MYFFDQRRNLGRVFALKSGRIHVNNQLCFVIKGAAVLALFQLARSPFARMSPARIAAGKYLLAQKTSLASIAIKIYLLAHM